MPRLGKLLVSEGDFLRSLGWMAQVALPQKSEQADGSAASKRACTEAQLSDPGGSHPYRLGTSPAPPAGFYPPCRVQDPACPGGEEAAGSALRRAAPRRQCPIHSHHQRAFVRGAGGFITHSSPFVRLLLRKEKKKTLEPALLGSRCAAAGPGTAPRDPEPLAHPGHAGGGGSSLWALLLLDALPVL